MKKKSSDKKAFHKIHKTKAQCNIFSYRFFFLALGCLLLFIFAGLQIYKNVSTVPCANSISCINNLSGEISSDTEGIFNGQKIHAPDATYFKKEETATLPVLGITSHDEKHIYVDLAAQRLYAFNGNTLVYNFFVSTGKWHPTPTGTFRIWIKLRATRMTGGSGADYYDLPNVPWTMFFANDEVARSAGFSLHGAFWHNNFGHPMSHGCINIRPDQAKLLFDWASPTTTGYTTYATTEDQGTLVTIYGAPPANDVAY